MTTRPTAELGGVGVRSVQGVDLSLLLLLFIVIVSIASEALIVHCCVFCNAQTPPKRLERFGSSFALY